MSDITCELVWYCIPTIEAGLIDMNTPAGRAAFWRMWVTLERELEAERMRQAATPSVSPNLAGVLGALAGVMAASQAAKPKDEDDGA